jgi:hypothetical protein
MAGGVTVLPEWDRWKGLKEGLGGLLGYAGAKTLATPSGEKFTPGTAKDEYNPQSVGKVSKWDIFKYYLGLGTPQSKEAITQGMSADAAYKLSRGKAEQGSAMMQMLDIMKTGDITPDAVQNLIRLGVPQEKIMQMLTNWQTQKQLFELLGGKKSGEKPETKKKPKEDDGV